MKELDSVRHFLQGKTERAAVSDTRQFGSPIATIEIGWKKSRAAPDRDQSKPDKRSDDAPEIADASISRVFHQAAILLARPPCQVRVPTINIRLSRRMFISDDEGSFRIRDSRR